MPFDRIVPRPLTTHGVRTFAPASPGVYGISNAHEWIYIGDSENIQASLLEHLGDPQSPVMKKQPTGFICELCDRAAQPARLERLILEYGPACNRQSTSRYS
jgi:excinuclease UvrABC nuclease subunit